MFSAFRDAANFPTLYLRGSIGCHIRPYPTYPEGQEQYVVGDAEFNELLNNSGNFAHTG